MLFLAPCLLSFLHQSKTILSCEAVKSLYQNASCCKDTQNDVTFMLSDDTSLGGLHLHKTYENGWNEYRYQTMGEDVYDIFTPVPVTHAILVNDAAPSGVDVIVWYHTFMNDYGMSGPSAMMCDVNGALFPYPLCDPSQPLGTKESSDKRWGIIHHGRTDRIYAFPTYPVVYQEAFQGDYGVQARRFGLDRRWDMKRDRNQLQTVTDRVVVENAKRIQDPIHKRVWETFGYKLATSRVSCGGSWGTTVMCAYANIQGFFTDSIGIGLDGENSVVNAKAVKDKKFVNIGGGGWRSSANTQLLGLSPVSLEQGTFRFNNISFTVFKQTLRNNVTNVEKISYHEDVFYQMWNLGADTLYQALALSRSIDYEDFVTWNTSFVSTLDYDGDGYEWPHDCNDFDDRMYPGAAKVPGNEGEVNWDSNCNGIYDDQEE